MNIQTIYLGLSANDSTGDTLRAGGFKINDNFIELYSYGPSRHRQSLLLYSNLSGVPNFLVPSYLNISLKSPIVATIGAGFEQRGERNKSLVIASDALSAWSVPDNTISYLYIEQNTLSGSPVYGYSSYAPYKSQVSSTSPNIGQHWFNTLYNQMYVWDGTAFDYVNRIFIASVTTSNGSVSSINYFTSNDEYDYTDASVLSAFTAANNYTTNVLTSSYNYTNQQTVNAVVSANNFTTLQTSSTLVSANTYADKSAIKYAIVFG